jgi:eukaryotic-like serine/threonine-protein kinase
MLARPPQLPGFVLGPRLGGGPTCDVYSAVDHSERRSWAVKVLRDDAARDETNVQLLRREARVGMSVRHPHLVRVVRARTEGIRHCHMVMERVAGQSVRQVLRRRGWLRPRIVALIARQTADALAALHTAGFVHGDVKPDNLHIGPGRTATLLDLGFAHRPGEDASFLGAGFVLGTANYVAPELLDATADGLAADVFSLGVTIFELLTGKLPYPSGDVERTLTCHRDGRPDSLWRWRGRWPIGLADLVDRMLSRNPQARPTATTIVRELEGLFLRTRAAA